MKVLAIRKRAVGIALCVLLCVSAMVVYFAAIRPTFQPVPLRTIVIDAGHGGRDGGAVGKASGITENELNLQYAETIKTICAGLGMRVVMTRSDLSGLYSPVADNKKRSDMEARQKIIQESGADVVLSVHMNAFPLTSSRGAQVFFDSKNQGGKELAQSIQTSLHDSIAYAKSLASDGDLYILNCTQIPGALVEFGFLSNLEEEELLLDESYRQNICYAVVCGILDYFRL